MSLWVKRKRILGCIIITGILIIVMLQIRMRTNEQNLKGESKSFLGVLDSNTIALYCPMKEVSNEVQGFWIESWERAKVNTYYFFLPAGMKDMKMYWQISADLTVWIEHKKIEHGDEFTLSERIYDVEVERNGSKQIKKMEVIFSEDIPTLFVSMDSRELEYIHAQKGRRDTGVYAIMDSEGIIEKKGKIDEIRGRGNVSWNATEKKSYQITLEEATPLLNMPEDKQWVLISNAFDDTLLRNKVSYEMAKEMSIPFTSECEYIDLYINGEYRGNYLLMEKVEVGENRIAIRDLGKETAELNGGTEMFNTFVNVMEDGSSCKGYRIPRQPEDITGGYLLELETPERYESEKCGFVTKRGQRIVIKSPQNASYEQVHYIKEKYQEFEDALFGENGINPETKKKYSDYIDVDSFVKKYVLEETLKNLDASLTSQYIYKPDDAISKKFFAGPVWDYDKSLGVEEIRGEYDLSDPEGLYVGNKKTVADIWYELYSKKDFKEKVQEYFGEEFLMLVGMMIDEKIPIYRQKIQESAEMNHVFWRVYYEIPREEKMIYYEENVEKMIQFLKKRIDYLKNEWEIK